MPNKTDKINSYRDIFDIIQFIATDHKAVASFAAGSVPLFNETDHEYPCVYLETGHLYTSNLETKRYTIALYVYDKVSDGHSVKDVIIAQTKLDNILHEIVQELRTYRKFTQFGNLDIIPTDEAQNDLLVGIRGEFQVSIQQLVTQGDTPFTSKITVVLPTTLQN